MNSLLASFDTFSHNLNKTLTTLQRSPASVRLMLVSKGVPSEQIAILAERRGHKWFAENRISELKEKTYQLRHLHTPIQWSYIGTLQSHKISPLISLKCEIQSVASYKHLLRIAAKAEKAQTRTRVYLQVNISDEAQKSGNSHASITDTITLWKKHHRSNPWVDIRGIMAIPSKSDSFDADQGVIPASFRQLQNLQTSLNLPELSLGMSQDWKSALAVGATTIRIGRAIFEKKDKP